VQRCILFNGIEVVATREDLLIKSAIFKFIKRETSTPVSELLEEFEQENIYIRGNF